MVCVDDIVGLWALRVGIHDRFFVAVILRYTRNTKKTTKALSVDSVSDV